jgi:hypothetical protein
MTNTILLSDSTRGTVEEIDGSTPSRGSRVADQLMPEIPVVGDGYVLASLGAPRGDAATRSDEVCGSSGRSPAIAASRSGR